MAYKIGSEKTKEKNNQLINEYKQNTKELKRIKEEITSNKKAAYTAGANKMGGGTFFDTKDAVPNHLLTVELLEDGARQIQGEDQDEEEDPPWPQGQAE